MIATCDNSFSMVDGISFIVGQRLVDVGCLPSPPSPHAIVVHSKVFTSHALDPELIQLDRRSETKREVSIFFVALIF